MKPGNQRIISHGANSPERWRSEDVFFILKPCGVYFYVAMSRADEQADVNASLLANSQMAGQSLGECP